MKLEFGVFTVLALATGCASSKCPGGPGAVQPTASEPGTPGTVDVQSSTGAAQVSLDADGRAWIDGQPVASDDQLAARLGSRAKGGQVTLSADGRVPHGRVISVIDRLRAAGVTRVAFTVGGKTTAASPPPASAPAGTEPGAPAPSEPPAPSSEPAASTAPAASLPEVIVETVGLHVGGGPNDEATKRTFLRAIEPQFDAFRACFVKAEEPEKGGTFGVDLFIGRAGGKPEVRQPRTAMKGSEFRKCVAQAFEQIGFEKPAKGPTVISYSIRYRLK
jgi:hypothetical protein